jgi:PAS domain S-box-containing protein
MRTPNVLVAEHDRTGSRDIQERLAGLGYRLAGAAATGEAVVALVAECRPDLVLIDAGLPGEMDGVATADMIQSQFRVPVVLLVTGEGSPDVERIRCVRPQGLLFLPSGDQEIKWTIDSALLIHAAAEEGDRLGRLQDACRQVGRAILRAANLETLFAAVCRTLVERGGFAGAGVGVPEASGARIRWLAQSGLQNPASDVVLVGNSAALRMAEASPVVEAFQGGEAVLYDDCDCGVCAGATMPLQARRTIAHAVFPLRLHNRVWGLLSIVATEPGFFHDREMRLFEEVTSDLACAMDTLETTAGLRESEARFRGLLESGPTVAVQGYSSEGITRYWNEASERLYGYTAEEAVGRSLLDLIIPPEARSEVEQAVAHMARTGQPIPPAELALMHKNGSRVPVFSSHAVVQVPGRAPELFCIDVDITERKQAEAAEQREHALNTAIIAALPGTFYVVNEAGYYVRWNARQRDEIVGKSDAEVARIPGLETIHPDDRDLLQAKMVSVLRDGREEHVQARVLLRGGPAFCWMLMTGRRMEMDGRPYVVGVGTDVTELKQAEAALRESEQRYRLLAENVTDVIWVLDLEAQRFTYVSPSVERLRGYTPDETLRLPLAEALTPDSLRYLQGVLPPRLDRFRQGIIEFFTDEVDQPHRDGHIIHTEVTTRFHVNRATGRIEASGVTRDASERKRRETYRAMVHGILLLLSEPGDLHVAIQRSLVRIKAAVEVDAVGFRLQQGEDYPFFAQDGFPEGFLTREASLLRRSPDGGCCRDADGNASLDCVCGLVLSGRVDPANPMFTVGGSAWTSPAAPLLELPADRDRGTQPRNVCIRFGYNSVALIPIRAKGRIVGLLQLNDRRPGRFTRPAIEALEDVAQNIGEAILRKQAEAALREVHSQLEARVAERTAALSAEVAERKQIEVALQRAKESADAANRAKSRFLANMSHEIRTPMNAILGFAQLMQRDSSLSVRQREQMATINRSGEHLLRLINDILDMSKIEAGRMEVTVGDCDFRSLLEDMETMFRQRADERHLQFTVQHGPGIPHRLLTDAVKVRQVLLNILSNAVKFTVHGGIHLAVAAEPVPGAVRLTIEVADTGPGIAPEEIDRVFDPFEQTQSGQRTAGGTGLGMPISRQLARMLGGDVTVISQLGAGSTFRFSFVAEELLVIRDAPTAAALPLPITRFKTRNPPPTVLVVDDVESNRDVLRQLLESVGFRVDEAVDGAQAVARCAATSPDLVLLDRRMPVMDGLAAARAIRAGPAGCATRILIVSASVLGNQEADCLANGADGFCGKPIHNESLLAQIGSLLGLESESEAPPPSTANRSVLSREAIARLPTGLRDRIILATEAGDVAELEAIIARELTSLDPVLAGALARLAARFDYAALLHALAGKTAS